MSLINKRLPIPYMKLIDNRVSVLNTKYQANTFEPNITDWTNRNTVSSDILQLLRV